MSKDRLALGSI